MEEESEGCWRRGEVAAGSLDEDVEVEEEEDGEG